MLAARILFLARTRRCAIVGSGTRNARAISGVCSPATSRSVSATWEAGASAGWQQVKTSRNRSSTSPSSSGSSSVALSVLPGRPRYAACTYLSWRVDSRRRRSIARLRAVVKIQPAGDGGTPAVGQVRTAVTNASWTASSATSRSPKRRARVATARPESRRKTSSTARAVAGSSVSAGSGGPTGPVSRQPSLLRNGRTSTGSRQATDPSAARANAASRSGDSMIQKPPICSLVST